MWGWGPITSGCEMIVIAGKKRERKIQLYTLFWGRFAPKLY